MLCSHVRLVATTKIENLNFTKPVSCRCSTSTCHRSSSAAQHKTWLLQFLQSHVFSMMSRTSSRKIITSFLYQADSDSLPTSLLRMTAPKQSSSQHPANAAHHLAGKSLFCQLDCSQAYHCLQMADQWSVEMLAFNFAGRTLAYKRCAQGLSRSVSAVSSFMCEYLDPVVKADHCAHYVDDTWIAGDKATDFNRNNRAVFKCIRTARLKLTIEKCFFGVGQVEFLWITISPEGISPQSRKVHNFPD